MVWRKGKPVDVSDPHVPVLYRSRDVSGLDVVRESGRFLRSGYRKSWEGVRDIWIADPRKG